MDVDNNFYDEISSFLPQPGDYSLEDLEEIIRSTDSNLDASLDMNTFVNDFDITAESSGFALKEDNHFHIQHIPTLEQKLYFGNETSTNFENDFKFSGFSTPATYQKSAGFLSPYQAPARTSTPTSMGGEHVNPDDFINFDDIKIEDFGNDIIMEVNGNCRNTPSPTGSCTSSSGSSTSGVQSDASSVASMSQNYKSSKCQEGDDDLLEFLKFKNEIAGQDIIINESSPQVNNHPVVIRQEDVLLRTAPAVSTLLPITVPVIPVTARPVVPPVNFVDGTLIPVRAIPLTPANAIVNVQAQVAFKTESKPSNKIVVAQSVKPSTAGTKSTEDASPKVTSPPNGKPKTIYLSSNDFKSLMQKMSANGKKIAGANGQIPKVIMKTANGKVIAANKITNISRSNTAASTVLSKNSVNNSLTKSNSSLNPQSHQFASKIVKTPGSMMITEQQSKAISSNAHSAVLRSGVKGTLTHTKIGRTNFGMLKNLNDDKLLKKQLRMLKNRQSASLSRKKKKEYIERLENRISNLEKENYCLKGENFSLRRQLMAFAQTCNCRHRNVSEFILNTLNMDGRSDGAVLNLMNNGKRHFDNCKSGNNNYSTDTTASTTHHIKIAPKPANAGPFINKGFKQRMNAAAVKKNVAILFAMAFMVTLNVGNFQNYLNKSALENAIDASAAGANEEPVVQTGRRLLWVPNEHEFHDHTNRTKRDIEKVNIPPPPLHFLRPVNRTTADRMNGSSAKDEPPIKKMTTYANATQENMRLARNLHKWIGGNGYLNLTSTGISNNFEDINNFKFGFGSHMDYHLPLQEPIGMKQKRKIIVDSQPQEKHAKLNTEDDRNSLGIFKPRISEEYLRLFKGIKRQDDTFYVLSFNMDHILLPASAYNKSSRPKMALMLPAGDPSHNGDITLMQIDCEVINTTELEIKSHMIPEKLRPSKYSANVRTNPNDVGNNNTAGPDSVAVRKLRNLPLNRAEHPAPRTYSMMGPKNQEASQSVNSIVKGSNILKRKPNVVKLNANNSVIGSGILNVRNSSLFSRMRDTVGSQVNEFLAATDVKK